MIADALVTTIIPTMALAERSSALIRSIESVRRSSSGPIQIIVVVNGGRADPHLCQWLRVQPNLELKFSVPASLPKALFCGRELVCTPYFSTLDDDDELLEGAMELRLAAMCSGALADVVVTNSYTHKNNMDTLTYDRFAEVSEAPLHSLFRIPWLHNGNALYRSASVQSEYFRDIHQYCEWTWLAFQLALDRKRVVALDIPTFRYYDTPGSLSKSDEYKAAYANLFQRMLSRQPPADVVALIRKRIGAFQHDESVRALIQGNIRLAIRSHLRSLLMPDGHRYLSYTRRLLPGWPKG